MILSREPLSHRPFKAGSMPEIYLGRQSISFSWEETGFSTQEGRHSLERRKEYLRVTESLHRV